MTGNEGVPHTIVVGMDHDVTHSQFFSPRQHGAENCEEFTFKNDCFHFDTLIIVKVSSVTSSKKKLTFSPKLLARTAPIPAVTFSALGSCDASVNMNHVDVLLALRPLGIFSRSSSRNLVGADKRRSDNRPSPASYACCVTADRHRLDPTKNLSCSKLHPASQSQSFFPGHTT